jgi:hypothetical protein
MKNCEYIGASADVCVILLTYIYHSSFLWHFSFAAVS